MIEKCYVQKYVVIKVLYKIIKYIYNSIKYGKLYLF